MDEGYSCQTCGERADPTGADEICLDVAIALAVVIVPEVERSLDDWTGPTWVTGQELVTVLVQETFLAVLALVQAPPSYQVVASFLAAAPPSVAGLVDLVSVVAAVAWRSSAV